MKTVHHFYPYLIEASGPPPPPLSLGHRTVNLAAYSLHLGFLRGRDFPWDGTFMTALAFYCCDLGSIPRPNVAL